MNPFQTHGIAHLSPSSINLFVSQPALWCMEKLLGKKSPAGCAAHRGIAAEDGIIHGLLNPEATVDECIDLATTKYRLLAALSGDPNKQKEGEAVPQLVSNGLAHLRPWGVPSAVQGNISYQFDGLLVPVIGKFDIYWEHRGIMTDVKTNLKGVPKAIKSSHARQVALYKAAISDNISASLTYVTNMKTDPAKPDRKVVESYELENYRAHLLTLGMNALAIQRFLSVSDDPHYLASIVQPDVDSFYFNDPIARQNAFEVYGF